MNTILDYSNGRLNLHKLKKVNNGVKTINLQKNNLENMPLVFTTITSLTSLNVSFNNLTTLSNSIGMLTSLTNLNLNNNKINSIPNNIGRLKKLDILDLHNNNIITLPVNIGNLKELTVLDLCENYITSLPTSLENFKKLKIFKLCDNNLITIPECIRNFNKLTELNLQNNEIKKLSDWIGELRSLRILELGNNKNIELTENLVQLSSLTYLDLSLINLTILPDYIGNIISLKKLSLFQNNLTSLPTSIRNLTSLKMIDLDNNNLTSLPDCIKNITSLTSISLSDNQLTTLPDWIGELTSLKTLNVSDNQLTSIPETIGNMLSLKKLYLNNNDLEHLPESIGNLLDLETLDTYGNKKLIHFPYSIGGIEKILSFQLTSLLNNEYETILKTKLKFNFFTTKINKKSPLQSKIIPKIFENPNMLSFLNQNKNNYIVIKNKHTLEWTGYNKNDDVILVSEEHKKKNKIYDDNTNILIEYLNSIKKTHYKIFLLEDSTRLEAPVMIKKNNFSIIPLIQFNKKYYNKAYIVKKNKYDFGLDQNDVKLLLDFCRNTNPNKANLYLHKIPKYIIEWIYKEAKNNIDLNLENRYITNYYENNKNLNSYILNFSENSTNRHTHIDFEFDEYVCFIICDGYGIDGDLCSREYIIETINFILNNNQEFKNLTIHKLFHLSNILFNKINNKITKMFLDGPNGERDYPKGSLVTEPLADEIRSSGTDFNMCLINRRTNMLYNINIGNSNYIVLRKNKNLYSIQELDIFTHDIPTVIDDNGLIIQLHELFLEKNDIIIQSNKEIHDLYILNNRKNRKLDILDDINQLLYLHPFNRSSLNISSFLLEQYLIKTKKYLGVNNKIIYSFIL
jgi:Leucine-rich repeat (LRR) protein